MGKHDDQSYSQDSHGSNFSSHAGGKKQKKAKLVPQKKQKPIHKTSTNKQKHQKNQPHESQKPKVYQPDLEFFDEELQRNYKPSDVVSNCLPQEQESGNFNHQKGQNQYSYSQSDDDQMADDIEDLRMMFVEFFNSIDQPNGLVFKKQFRNKLKKMFPKIHFDDEHDLNPDTEEAQKIKPEIKELHVFDQSFHKTAMSSQEFEKYIADDVKTMQQVFKESSYIFCREVTHELYSILRKLCNIAIESRGKGQNQKNTLKRNLRDFGIKLASQTDKQHQYFFFGYQFVKFPQGKTAAQLLDMEGKQKFKYALKMRFREGKQFADLTEKAGRHLLEHMSKLKCFKTLV